MDQIVLKNMAFYGYHGVMDCEKNLGQRFYVDVTLEMNLTKAGQSDHIEDTIHYGEVYQIIEERFKHQRFQLLEKVAADIADTVYATFHELVAISVTVRKPSAPIPGVLDYVEVTIHR